MGDKAIIGKDILKQFTLGFANLIFHLDMTRIPTTWNCWPPRVNVPRTVTPTSSPGCAHAMTAGPFLLHIEVQNDNVVNSIVTRLKALTRR